MLKTIGMTALTTFLSIAVLFLLAKYMGAKQVSQRTMFDYVEGITIGSVAAELATELERPIVPLTALILYGLAAVWISDWTSKPLKLRGNLRQAGKVESWLHRALLRQGFEDEKEVLLALWDGREGLHDFPLQPTSPKEGNGS